jgi:hypothetical protein
VNYADPARTKRIIIVATAFGLLAGLISSLHHWYGAVVYETPWRSGVSYWIGGSVLIVYSLLYLYWKNSDDMIGRVSLWIFFFGAVVFQTGFIMFECVYSHVLKNLLFFVGAPHSILERMYPSPAYHLPDNLFFEFTGLLQLVGLLAVWFAYRIFQDRPWAK